MLSAVSIQDNVDHGVLAAFADGSFTYTPAAGFVGADGFACGTRDASSNFAYPVPVAIRVINPAAACVPSLSARAKGGRIQLTWSRTGAHHCDGYRGTIDGGPYLKIGSTTSTYSTCLDGTVVNGKRYYYFVQEADAIDIDSCQSNQAAVQAVKP